MNDLLEYIGRELPIINKHIDDEVNALHELVRPVAAHVMTAGGKRLRPVLTVLYARALGYTDDDIYPLAISLEFLHSATLLHDDILDSAELRRGKTAAHLIYSKGQTILAGDMLLALANKLVADYGIPALVSALSDAIMKTCVGEIAEIASLDGALITHDEYMEIITGKTAFLLQAATRCGAILAGADDKAVSAAADMGLNLGIAFQIVDDALDYDADAAKSGKPVGGDLREGKLTLPLIHYLELQPEEKRRELAARIGRKDFSDEEIIAIVQDVMEKGCTEKTRECAAEYLDKAAQAVSELPECIERSILEQALQYVLKRDK